MASGMLMGAGLGAATSLATGQDPLKGAAIGGAMGGIGGAMSSAPTAGTGAYSGATSMMTNPGLTETASSSMFGGLGDTIGQGFDWVNDKTGMENRDWTMMGLNQGANALSQPQQQPQLNVPQASISRPQFQPGMQGGGMLTSNPMQRKRQGLL